MNDNNTNKYLLMLIRARKAREKELILDSVAKQNIAMLNMAKKMRHPSRISLKGGQINEARYVIYNA